LVTNTLPFPPEGQRRAVVIRAGGLGDFVLALPLIRRLGRLYESVHLATRREYWRLVEGDGLAAGWLDVDAAAFGSLFSTPSVILRRFLARAHVYSFMPDTDDVLKERLLAAGAGIVTSIPSKPEKPPHIAKGMLLAAGLEPDDDLLITPALRKAPRAGGGLWLHPGSGGTAKNAPMGLFRARAEEWMKGRPDPVVLSFGAADMDLLPVAREAFRGLACRFVVSPALGELRRDLEDSAGRFIGNDSGVTHLAAALGIPAEVFFLNTDPEIWAPVGREVKIIRL